MFSFKFLTSFCLKGFSAEMLLILTVPILGHRYFRSHVPNIPRYLSGTECLPLRRPISGNIKTESATDFID